MLSWIPILGPIIEGIVSIFNKKMDTDVQKYQTDATVITSADKTASTITTTFKDDLAVKLARDVVMFPGSLWCGLYVYGRIMDIHYPQYVFAVKPLEGPMEYLPFALLTFFFGMSYLNWRKR